MSDAATKHKQVTFADMLAVLNLARSSAYHMMATDPSFPKGAKIGRRRMFLTSDLDAWLAAKHSTVREG